LELYRRMPIELRAVDLGKAVSLSHRLGIYAYDGYMLQCALDTAAELLTLDRGLKAAAKAAGVPLREVLP
jgi:predicted nucleic acid-binding protein